ncbi:MAG: hypothetical protein ABI674_11260 [Spartobacteria bacterium]
MNIQRLLLTVVVAFVFIFATDFAIHAIWLKPAYEATKELWRSEAEMGARFPWMLGAQLLVAIVFVTIWALGFAERGGLGLALGYGLLIGVIVQATTIITYVVSPLPADIAVKWIASGLVQSMLLGLIVGLVYKPARKRAFA